MSCENCGGSCGICNNGSCGAVVLTETELALLLRLGEIPFLPVAAAWDRKTPVYLEDGGEEYGPAILGLAAKGLLRLDYDIPLQNFDYDAYGAWPLHGSMALTGRGQDVLEQIEIQGIEE